MDPFVGEIKMLGFHWAPVDWALCSGGVLPIQQYPALYSLIGTHFGGDAQTTFALPDLQGRMPRGQGNGSGLTPVAIGQKAGAEHQTLTATEMPVHNHSASFTGTGCEATVKAATDEADASVPTSGAYLAESKKGRDSVSTYLTNTAPTSTVALGGVSCTGGGTVEVGNAGGSQPFSLMNPYLALNFSIALQGIYPQRP